MPAFDWIIIAIVGVVLGLAALYDRRMRGRSRRLRSAEDMDADRRDIRSSVRGTRFGMSPRMETWRKPGDGPRN